jgi:hypothetical protein
MDDVHQQIRDLIPTDHELRSRGMDDDERRRPAASLVDHELRDALVRAVDLRA